MELSYQELLEDAVRRYTDKPIAWGDLVSKLSGACPIAVSAIIRKLNRQGQISFPNTKPSPAMPVALQQWSDGLIPTPHIVDSTWWFADSALTRLARMIAESTRSDDVVLLLGTPTLYFWAKDLFPDRNLILVDKTATSSEGGTRRADVRNNSWSVPRTPTLVVADPPWYQEDLIEFLAVASRQVVVGGRVVMSFPGSLTRPGIDRDRAALLTLAHSMGLRLEQHLISEIRYVSPAFEWNAYRAAGVSGVPFDWRSGDLLVFAKAEEGTRTVTYPSSRSEPWSNYAVGLMRFMLLGSGEMGPVAPTLQAIVSGDVLPTVSRRDRRLSEVRLWTSGNRVFGCQGAGELAVVLAALAERKDPLSGVRSKGGSALDLSHRSAVEKVANRLHEIAAHEERELADWKQQFGPHLGRSSPVTTGYRSERESTAPSGGSVCTDV